MAHFRLAGLTVLALTVLVQTARTEEPRSVKKHHCPTAASSQEKPAYRTGDTDAAGQICVIYSLKDLGDDTEFGQWIAETIPQVIEPGSWNHTGTPGNSQVLRYYAPKKILVVYHTPAVQAKVDSFLKSLKKALPQDRGSKPASRKKATRDRGVVPARYLAPSVMNPPQPAPEPTYTYPVPVTPRPPKHLFHFIIRYEGAGIIDSNVIKFMKAQTEQKAAAPVEDDKKEEEEKEAPEKATYSANPTPHKEKEDKKTVPNNSPSDNKAKDEPGCKRIPTGVGVCEDSLDGKKEKEDNKAKQEKKS
jgi:hypothetical protein